MVVLNLILHWIGKKDSAICDVCLMKGYLPMYCFGFETQSRPPQHEIAVCLLPYIIFLIYLKSTNNPLLHKQLKLSKNLKRLQDLPLQAFHCKKNQSDRDQMELYWKTQHSSVILSNIKLDHEDQKENIFCFCFCFLVFFSIIINNDEFNITLFFDDLKRKMCCFLGDFIKGIPNSNLHSTRSF